MESFNQSPRGSPRSPMKSIVTGKTVQPTEKQKETLKQAEEMKDQQNFVFATHKKLKLGPG